MIEQSRENPILKLASKQNTGQFLYFFGAHHTNNPADTQFAQLDVLFNEFLKIAVGKKVIFVEGKTQQIPQDYKESIREYGEAGATAWLANTHSIEMFFSEPSEQEQRKLLSSVFESELVAYTVIVQNLASWFRHVSDRTFVEAVTTVLNREAKYSNIYNFVPDKLWLETQHKKLFNTQLLEDKTFLESITDPRKKVSVINNIVAHRSLMRNEYILLEITKRWQAGESIFVIYGKGHLISMEESLKKLVA